MFIEKIRTNIMIEKLREIEFKNFDTEKDASLFAAYTVSIFRNDFKELSYEIVKSKAIVIEGPEIGKWVDNYTIAFRFREM